MATHAPLLTIVITAKNEQSHIAAAIDASLKALQGVDGEVLLVDSHSADDTVEIARRYPIRIVRLGKDWFHSNSAGRFTGANNAKGTFVWFVDGDMTPNPAFVSAALEFLQQTPSAAGVMGILEDPIPFENRVYRKLGGEPLPGFSEDRPSRLKYILGGGFFRRDALLKAGSYDPYLSGEEEIDISQRLRAAGHELYYLPVVAAVHHGRSSTWRAEVMRRVRRNLYAGLGTNLVRSLRSPLFGELLQRYRIFLLALSHSLLTILLLMVAAIAGNYWPALLALASELLALTANAVAKKSFQSGFRAYITQKIIVLCMVKGMMAGLRPRPEYPLDVEVIPTSRDATS